MLDSMQNLLNSLGHCRSQQTRFEVIALYSCAGRALPARRLGKLSQSVSQFFGIVLPPTVVYQADIEKVAQMRPIFVSVSGELDTDERAKLQDMKIGPLFRLSHGWIGQG